MEIALPTIETGENDIKERLSVGVVTLIAARAGCEVCEYKVDRTSRDLTITPVAGAPVSIDVQLKSTVNLVHTGQTVKFDLDIKNYNDLRQTQVGTARILIVVDLHTTKNRWLRSTERHLVFDRCAYWLSLYGAPATTNKKTVRVDIPRAQVLTPAELERIIELRYQRIQGHHGGF
jgi:hypothetical protein